MCVCARVHTHARTGARPLEQSGKLKMSLHNLSPQWVSDFQELSNMQVSNYNSQCTDTLFHCLLAVSPYGKA